MPLRIKSSQRKFCFDQSGLHQSTKLELGKTLESLVTNILSITELITTEKLKRSLVTYSTKNREFVNHTRHNHLLL